MKVELNGIRRTWESLGRRHQNGGLLINIVGLVCNRESVKSFLIIERPKADPGVLNQSLELRLFLMFVQHQNIPTFWEVGDSFPFSDCVSVIENGSRRESSQVLPSFCISPGYLLVQHCGVRFPTSQDSAWLQDSFSLPQRLFSGMSPKGAIEIDASDFQIMYLGCGAHHSRERFHNSLQGL